MFSRPFKLLLLIALLLSACGSAPAQPRLPLRVAWSLWPGWYPLIIANQKGLFEKRGVDVELFFYATYKETMPALGAGMLDGGALALGDTLLDDVSEDVSIVLITDVSNGADQIVAAPGITRPQDLKGKRIGMQAGTHGEIFVQHMLDANGISRSEVQFMEIPVEDIPNAIPDVIDAGHTFEPYASQSRAKGFAPIFTSADTPGLLLDVIAFRASTLEQRPGDVKAFIAAWFDAVKYWQENPAEGNAVIARTLNFKESEISLKGIQLYGQKENLAAFRESDDTTSIYYPARIEVQFLSDKGIISYPITIDANFLNPSFLQ
jgi:NitT/TauT family transport system substrate-binding protein